MEIWTITFAIAHLLEGGFVAEVVLARFDDEGEACRDGLGRLCGLGLFCGSHCVVWCRRLGWDCVRCQEVCRWAQS